MPPLICAPRSPEKLKADLDGLKVETTQRYLPEVFPGQGRRTKCNKVAEDICEIQGIHLPKGLLAREQIAWLASPAGRTEGWFELNARAADEAVGRGQLVLVCWVNPDPAVSSHIAPMRAPGRITQAGRTNFTDGTIAQGFGSRVVQFYGHL